MSVPRSRRLLLLVVQIAAAVLLLEVALRIVAPRVPSVGVLLRHEPSVDHLARAASLPELLEMSPLGFNPLEPRYGFVLNSRGLRTSEYADRPAAGTRRIVTLGDSFAFASGALPHAWHWPTLLEERLGSGSPEEVEVLRLGVPATGPAFYLRLWQLEGRRLGADDAVVAVFVGNDLANHVDAPPAPDASWLSRIGRHWWGARAVRGVWRLARGVEDGLHGLDRRRRESGGYPLVGYADRFDPDRPTFTPEQYLRIEIERAGLLLGDDGGRFDRLWAQQAPILISLLEEIRAAGARPVLMIIPDELQVDRQLLETVLEATGRTAAVYDLERPQRALRALCTAEGVTCVDLLPAFREAAPRTRLYRPRDSHWNAAGNALAAEILARELAAKASAVPTTCRPEVGGHPGRRRSAEK